MRNILIKCKYSPGDLLMLSVAIRDLHLNYPNEFKTEVFSYYPEVFYNNRFITKLSDKDKPLLTIDLDYGSYLRELRDKDYHFSDCFIKMFNDIFDLKIKKFYSNPCIHLTDEEKNRDYIINKYGEIFNLPYWLITPGIKVDIPLKGYPPDKYQEIIILLNKQFKFNLVQVGHSTHISPLLKGVINLVGKTDNLRDLFSLMYHAEGSIGSVSLQMHLAAAFNKPCVVLAGLREQIKWEKYDNHIYLFSSCEFKHCWKSYSYECKNLMDKSIYPECLNIDPKKIVKAILSY